MAVKSDQGILQRVACKALISLNSKLLVLREASSETYAEGTSEGKWYFPGGRINPGEPFLDGLYREVREETGLTVTAGEPIGVSEWFPVIKGQPNHIVAIFFACTPAVDTKEADVRLSEEHDAYRWVAPVDLLQFGLLQSEHVVLQPYLRRITNSSARSE